MQQLLQFFYISVQQLSQIVSHKDVYIGNFLMPNNHDQLCNKHDLHLSLCETSRAIKIICLCMCMKQSISY